MAEVEAGIRARWGESGSTGRIAGGYTRKNATRLRRFIERLTLAAAALIRFLVLEGIAPIKARDFGVMQPVVTDGVVGLAGVVVSRGSTVVVSRDLTGVVSRRLTGAVVSRELDRCYG